MVTINRIKREQLYDILGITAEQGETRSYNDLVYEYTIRFPHGHPGGGAVDAYTKAQTDTFLASKSPVGHDHDERYVKIDDSLLLPYPYELNTDEVLDIGVNSRLTLPTHDGSGQATHPSVVYVEGGWNGYPFWMCMTPYPNANDDHEDPNILVAHAPTGPWTVPPGLTNPIHDMPGTAPGNYNADVELVHGPDNKMHLWWKNNINNTEERILYSSSSDGITWATPVSVISGPVGVAVSPTVVYDDGVWHMWSVNLNFAPGDTVKRLEYRSATSPDGPWSAPTVCVLPVPEGRHPWHIDVIKMGSLWVGVLNDCAQGTNGGDGNLYFISSRSGKNWFRATNTLVAKPGANYTRLYRATLLPVIRGGKIKYDLFYGVVTAAGEWYIHYTRLEERDTALPISVPIPAINHAQGVWTAPATAGNDTTTPSDRFFAEWRNGICTVHIDFKSNHTGSLTVARVVGTLPSNVPPPIRLVEHQISPITPTWTGGVSAYIRANERTVYAYGPGDLRTIARLVYHY